MDQRFKTILFTLGRPLSPFYGTAMKTRAALYRRNMLRQHRLNVPVISVGNLTMGGTGKTPFVVYLARLLKKRGYNPAVVSRGYHGKSRSPVNIVSEGHGVLMSSADAGDEPTLIAGKLPSTAVLTGKKRYRPAFHAVENFHADLILLDDGFQHLGLFRDLDFVLFDIDHFAGNSRVFPGGELREPVTALERCNAFILTGLTEENRERSEKIEQLLMKRFPAKELFSLSRTFTEFYRYDVGNGTIEKKPAEKSDLPQESFVFSGIANPDRFYRMLEAAGIPVSANREFSDHHAYRAEDIEKVCESAQLNNCPALITTEKDIVKLKPSFPLALPVYVPVLDYAPNQKLDEYIMRQINDYPA